jgi:hypothetical protein
MTGERERVHKAAVKKLENQAFLQQIADADSDYEVRRAARERLILQESP